jgi:hypothetical protein
MLAASECSPRFHGDDVDDDVSGRCFVFPFHPVILEYLWR